MKNIMDIFTTLMTLFMIIKFVKSKLLPVSTIEILEFIALAWIVWRLGTTVYHKIQNKLLEKEIKRKKKYYR